MKIGVYRDLKGRATYEVNGERYGFLEPAPTNQAEFDERVGPGMQRGLCDGTFLACSQAMYKQHTFVCEVEA